MKTLKTVSLLTLVCFLVNLLSGCRSWKPMEQGLKSREDVVAHINPGDELIIRLKDQDEYTITVESIDTYAIVGNGKKYLFSDIDEIYYKGVSPGKTVAVGVGGTVLLGVGLTVLLLAALFGVGA